MPIRRHHLRKNVVYSDNIKDSQVKTADIADNAVTKAKIPDGELPYTKLQDDAIIFKQEIGLLGGAAQSVPADSVAEVEMDHTLCRITGDHATHWHGGYCVVDYTWAATADGKIQLYDTTYGVVLGESPAKSGGEAAELEMFDIDKPAGPADVRIRVAITTAGATGETVTVYRAKVRILTRVS